jgi:PAS domain S-box-containing protein
MLDGLGAANDSHEGCPVDFFIKLLDTSDFPARWHCGNWTPGHGWLHILSDLGVWSAYLAIPCVLGYFVLRRKDVPFRAVFWLFVAFILACGITHLMEAILFWWPVYRLAGLIKLVTAVVSWSTVVALVPSVPQALAMRSPRELEREIAERTKVEEALRLANARFDLAVRSSNIGIWEIDMPDADFTNGRVDLTNVLEQLGYDRPDNPADFATRMTLVHPDDRERVERAIAAYLSGDTWEFEVEHRVRHRDGSSRWMLTRGVAMRDPAGRPIRMIGSSIDITDHKQADEKLREYYEHVQTLSHQLLTVQEEERRHLARELHDEIGQVLATINFQFHAAKGLAGASALPRLEECGALLQQAGEQVRSLALELRPTMLDTLGLEATLRWLGERHQQRTGCEVQIVGHLSGAPLAPEMAIACFRVVQEALTNVVRHAAARHFWIELSQSESVLELVVRDDGVGFDVAATQEQAARRGRLGLLGMAERVHPLGGTLQVESEPGRGTRIRASFPSSNVSEQPAEPEE